MLKRISLILVLLAAALCLQAQDIITKTDGSALEAKVLEVSRAEVKYRKASNPDGPVYTLPASEIYSITYANGETELFRGSAFEEPDILAAMPVAPGMKYRDYKNLYIAKNYVRSYTDTYNPFWIGFAEFCIPGLGEAITGEWGRAAAFFGANVGLYLVSINQLNEYDYDLDIVSPFLLTTLARLCVNVWGICDAVKVAKVKNLYNRDLLKLQPSFAMLPAGASGLVPTAGMSLTLNF